eukprot:TRINITY_DN3327_c0_g1_i2.p1 TRINITY_DN3327_c0_g1~~TRINITY_DN3327_c0_g1_i2.p1  ORF type:complete len:652 (+),score=140.54 TRINITY_DN3327_c0_g1_i2:38-1993(+)
MASNTSVWGIFSSILISVGIGFAIFILWCLLRKPFSQFLGLKANSSKKTRVEGSDEPKTTIEILDFTRRCTAEKLLKTYSGIDQVLYLLFLKYTAFYLLVCSVLAIAVLLPVNYTAGNKDKPSDDIEHTDGLNTISLANIENGSSRLWAHMVMAWAFTALGFYYLYRLYHQSCAYNSLLERPAFQQRTIMARGLSNSVKTDDDLRALFATFHGDDRVTNAAMLTATGSQRKRVKQRAKLYLQWQKAAAYEQEKGERLEVNKAFLRGPKVDAIDLYRDKLDALDAKMVKAINKRRAPTSWGFVAFDTPTDASLASQALHQTHPDRTHVELAADPNDVYWEFLNFSYWHRHIGGLISFAMLTALFLFWTIPVVFITGISNLESLSKLVIFDFLIVVLSYNDFVKGLIQGLLASLALMLFMMFLPLILTMLLRLRCYHLRSHLSTGLMTSYWLFLVLNVFLVYSIAGSLLGQIEDFVNNLNHASELVTSIALSLPANATFFINYIVVNTFISKILGASRLIPLVIFIVKKRFLFKTKFDTELALAPTSFSFDLMYANDLLVFMITMSYSLLQPIVIPFGFLYFGISYWAHKHNMIYAWSEPYQGMNLTPRVITLLACCFLFFQATMAAALGLKQFPVAVLALVPIVAALIFAFR